mgnify:FL=1
MTVASLKSKIRADEYEFQLKLVKGTTELNDEDLVSALSLPLELTLIKSSYISDEDSVEDLLTCIDKGDYISVQEHLGSRLNPNGTIEDPGRPLYEALRLIIYGGRNSRGAYRCILQKLLDAGADTNAPAGSEENGDEVIIPHLLGVVLNP